MKHESVTRVTETQVYEAAVAFGVGAAQPLMPLACKYRHDPSQNE